MQKNLGGPISAPVLGQTGGMRVAGFGYFVHQGRPTCTGTLSCWSDTALAPCGQGARRIQSLRAFRRALFVVNVERQRTWNVLSTVLGFFCVDVLHVVFSGRWFQTAG